MRETKECKCGERARLTAQTPGKNYYCAYCHTYLLSPEYERAMARYELERRASEDMALFKIEMPHLPDARLAEVIRVIENGQ